MLRSESIMMLQQMRKEGKSISSISSISRYTETHKGWTHSEYRGYALGISENNPMRRKKRETKEMDCRRKVAIVLESLEVQKEGQKSVENGKYLRFVLQIAG